MAAPLINNLRPSNFELKSSNSTSLSMTMAALSDHPPSSSSSSSASPYPRKRRRHTPLLSAVAIVSLTIALFVCPTTSVHAAHTATSINNGGLRGPPQQQLQQQELHPNGSIGIPQHGQQSPKREQHNRRRRELLQGEKGRTNPLQSIYEENLKRKADNLRIRQQQYAKKKKQQQMVQNADRFKKKNQNNGGGGSRLKTKKQQNTNNDGSRPGRNPNGTKRPKKGRPGSNNNMGRPKLGRPGRNPNNGNKRPNKNKKPNRPWKPSNNMRPNNGLLTKKPGNPPGINDKKPGNPPGINGNKKPDNTNNIKPQSQQVNNKPQDEDDSSSKPGKDQNKPSKDENEIVDMSSSVAATTDNKPSKDKPDYIVVKPGKNNPQEEEEDIVNMASSVTSAVDSIQPLVTSNNDKPGKDKPEQGVVKPGKMSPFEIALAHMHITMSEYDNLSKEKQDEIKALVDGKFNLGLMMEEQSDAATTVNNDGVVSGQVIELDWNFVPSVKDTSSLLDSFEHHPDLNWDDNNSSNDLAWSVSDVYASEGDMSIQSGISNVINSEGGGDAVYSNLTLVTEPNFVGGVLTFKVLSNSLTLPLEAFWVEVDDDVMLTPDVTASKSSGSSSSGSEWVEYSVPVNDGRHNVKWVHVYNPFSLPSLPPPPSGGEVGAGTLYMDELRHVPFTTTSSNVEMTRSGKNGGNNDGASWWDTTKNGSTIVATSSSMSGNRGSYTDVNFDLYTLNGGTLVYDVQTSTTAPHDDMTILINNEIVEAIFGDMIGYERRELVVPKGKAGITLRHRKNPGGLSGQVLRSLGVVGTEGKTWLKELGFVVG